MLAMIFWGLIALLTTVGAALTPNGTEIKNLGVVLFPGFNVQDIAGPAEAFLYVTQNHTLNLYFIAPTLDPVSSASRSPSMNPTNSTYGVKIVPTHTYDDPPELDFLLVPGGIGTRAPDLDPTVEYVRDAYPGLKYLMTVCTGAGIAARAGILDGRNATTNKAAWKETTTLGPNVKWISHARWVVDGNIWTTSGVSAGIDGALDYVQAMWGIAQANRSMVMMEYDRHWNSSWDPYAEYWGLG